MFDRTPAQKTWTDKEIDRLHEKLEGIDPASEEYAKIMTQVERHTKLVASHKKEPLVKPETWVMVGGNLAGIFAILSYERVHVVTSKALGFVLKSRL